MALPTAPLTLSVQQIEDLSQHFSFFRHDVNNSAGLIGAAAELMRYSPDAAKRWSVTLIEQPPRIAGKTREFIGEAERVLTIRSNDEATWYRDMWSRSNAPPAEPTAAVQVGPDVVKALHQELLNLHKEVTQLAFTVSGVEALTAQAPASAGMATTIAVDQLSRTTRKFDQLASLFEKTFGVASMPHRLLTGVPVGSVTIPPEEVALFHRRLTNLERDIHEHLGPLLELSQLARTAPDQLQARAGEFAPHAPEISTLVQKFGAEFDRTFGLARGK
jgi:hypothetical protein